MAIWPETKITLNHPQRYKLQLGILATGGVLRRRDDMVHPDNFEIPEPLKIFFYLLE